MVCKGAGQGESNFVLLREISRTLYPPSVGLSGVFGAGVVLGSAGGAGSDSEGAEMPGKRQGRERLCPRPLALLAEQISVCAGPGKL